ERLRLVVVMYHGDDDDDEKPCINNNDSMFEYSAFVIDNLIPLEAVVKSADSSIIDVVRDTPRSSGKRLCKQPSVATPLKACEGKTPISQELEDSDADSLLVQAVGRKRNVCHNLSKQSGS
nr:hypothetical protein [Tanacetum cinerariifolium]